MILIIPLVVLMLDVGAVAAILHWFTDILFCRGAYKNGS